MHFAYIDDSRDNKLACFSAILVPVDSWNVCLNRLIAIRRIMKQSDGVPLRMSGHYSFKLPTLALIPSCEARALFLLRQPLALTNHCSS